MSILSVRRPLALLAVLGMVAALLFAVVGTASAADPVPTKTALFSACPDNAGVPDPGFSDVPAGTFFYGSVSCLAYYAVTTGVTPDTYEPGADVTRAQMALFLERAAAAAGVVLDSTPPDAGFTDIAGLSVEAQTAINALADAGIVKGKTATTYEPASTVTRQQMALFLTRYLGEATKGPGGHALGEAATSGSPFTDIGATTVEANVAISQAWDLGIATGTTATTYEPLGNVNRGQMALFMTRMFAQANVRPAGVNIQANPMVIEGAIASSGTDPDPDGFYSVTARNADFTPAVNVHIDAFSFDADKATDTPFKTDGTCVASDVASEWNPTYLTPPGFGEAADVCKVSTDDAVTNTNGNITWMGDAAISFGGIADPFTTFYAWTGALGAMFDVDTTTYSSVQIAGVPKPPSYTGMDLEIDSKTGVVPLGTTVTWTAQLTRHNEPFAEADVEITFNDGWATSDASNTDTVVKTDATGKATYSRTETIASKSDVDANTADGYSPDDTVSVEWTDAAAVATKVVVSQPTEYKVIATPPAPNTSSVTAKVYDQYGEMYTDPGTIQFQTSVGYGSWDDLGSLSYLVNGVATRPYTWDPTVSNWLHLRAKLIAPALFNDEDDNLSFFWVNVAEKTDAPIMFESVDVADMANKALVLDGGSGYLLFTWDAGDRFNASDDANETPFPTDMAGFEKQLMRDNDPVDEPQGMEIPFYDPAGVSEFHVKPQS